MILILQDGRNERKQIGVASDGSRVHWTRVGSRVRVYHYNEGRFLNPGEWAWEEIARKQEHATDTYKELRSASDSVGETKDCAVVAYAAVTGCDYAHALNRMYNFGRRYRDGTNFETITKPALIDEGFYVIWCREKFQGRTIRTVCRQNEPGRFLVGTSGHILAMIDGEAVDWSRGRLLRVIEVWQVFTESEYLEQMADKKLIQVVERAGFTHRLVKKGNGLRAILCHEREVFRGTEDQLREWMKKSTDDLRRELFATGKNYPELSDFDVLLEWRAAFCNV